MQTGEQIDSLKYEIKKWKANGNTIGFVPTMGALHAGHLSLIHEARKQCDKVIVSIYVNPTQFNNKEDLKAYPRILEQDMATLSEIEVDYLFTPTDEIMYAGKSHVQFDFGFLAQVMEGAHRPGHFSGVGLIVSKLFHIVQPDKAFFGEKDFQQLAIIKALNKDLMFGIEIIGVPIKREADGLAMSSRNTRLSAEEREHALIFYKSLLKAQDLLNKGAEMTAVKNSIQEDFNLAAEDTKLEYIELVDADSLQAKENVNSKEPQHNGKNSNADEHVLCIAGYVGSVRLIDNLLLES